MEKRKKIKRWIISTALLLVIVAIGVIVIFFNPKKGLKLVLPDVDDITLAKASIKNDTAYVGVDMVLENKSIFKLDIDTLFYKITLADSLLFKETKALNIKQKPGEKTQVELPLRIPIHKTMRTIKFLQQQDSTYIEIDAYIVYNTIFGSKKIPVSKRVKIKVPVPPQIKVEHIETDHVSLSKKTADITATIKIINKGELLDLNIHKIHYSISLGNKLVTSNGTFDKPIAIKPSSEILVKIPITVEVNKVLKTVWKFVTNEKLEYHIKVTAELDENSFYKKTDIPLEITATGNVKLRKK